jgi:hypothetical protein
MVKRSIDELKEQIEQFEAMNQVELLRSAKGRLNNYMILLEKIRAL